MSETPENIELQEFGQGNVSDTSSEVSEIASSVGGEPEGEFEEGESEQGEIEKSDPEGESEEEREHEDSDESSCVSSNSGTPSVSGEAVENSSTHENKSEVSVHKSEASDQENSGSDSSSDDSSDEGESIAPVPTNKGKQRATGPVSILKKDTGKESKVVPSPENNKHTTKRCTRCDRPVFKIRPRYLPTPVNSTAEEATDMNTIYNLEGYHTLGPVTILCDRCCAIGKAIDRYKKQTVVGEKFVKGSEEARKARQKYRVAVIECEKALTRSSKRRNPQSSNKPAVSFEEGVSDTDEAGMRSGAAGVASTAITVSFGPFPEPVDGVGAVRNRKTFNRGDKKHYKPGRWSWEATWERGDLEEYDYDEDVNSSSDGDESSMASSTIAESSAMGAARTQEPEDRNEIQGWLNTSGFTIRTQDYYDGIKNPAKDPRTTRTRSKNTTMHTRGSFDPNLRPIIKRRKEPTVWGYLKELGEFWCCRR